MEGQRKELKRRKIIGGLLATVGATVLASLGRSSSASSEPNKDKRTYLPIASRRAFLTGRIETPPQPESSIGKGEAIIKLAYSEKTNLNDPRVKANVEEDMYAVKELASEMPVVGYPELHLSAQERYGYDFIAVDKDSIGRYNESQNPNYPDYMFLNMEVRDPEPRKHLVWHELGGHYLDPEKRTPSYIDRFVDPESRRLAIEAKQKLMEQLRRYKGRPAVRSAAVTRQLRWTQGISEGKKPYESFAVQKAPRQASSVDWDADLFLEEKLRNRQQVTWDEIVNASNKYPQDVWEYPHEYLEFRNMVGRDDVRIQARADKELYAEFTAYLLQAQDLGLFNANYKHPVHEIYWELKRATQQGAKAT